MHRIPLIDQLRAVSIFLIVYGHNHYDSDFAMFLSSFRLPMFFIISGYISKNKSRLALESFMKKMLRRILIPYFLISLILYTKWYFINRHFGESVLLNYDPVKNFIGIFYAQGGNEYMNWGVPMWFLPALFCVSLTDLFISKIGSPLKPVFVLFLPLIGYYSYALLGFHLPWSADISMVVYPYYYFGTQLNNLKFKGGFISKEMIVLIGCFILHLLAYRYNKTISFYYGSYGFLPLTYLLGIIGSIWLFLLIKIMPANKYICWLGQNTLPILAFHLSAMTVIKGVSLYFWDVTLDLNLWNSFIYTLIQILILVPVILLMNRYTPFLTGYRSFDMKSESESTK